MRAFRLLLIALLVSTGIALAQETASPGEGIRGRTLTCATNLELKVACFIEQTAFAAGPFEVAVGLDADLFLPAFAVDPFVVDDAFTFGGYLIFGWYEPGWGVWAEAHLPVITPVIGTPDWLRLGFTVRF